ncbi:MAG TPA: low molecular weight protein-tyrosine-phosphatase [Candidatus Binatia bacterium]|nr:low molecular weight protein-tyrosine-phosphatase [Candidatus Binatia bacterium]
MSQDAAPKTSSWKSLIRKLIPKSWLVEREKILRLGPAGKNYARLRVMDTLGMRSPNARPAPGSARSFVFVCFGNIMRSAVAEALMNQEVSKTPLAGKLKIASAGLHARTGSEAHPWMQEAARDLGISLASHRSQQLSPEMVAQADCILAMDFQNKAELLALYPEAENKICMMGAYAEGELRSREIPDPYHGDLEQTRRCARQLQICVRNLLDSLLERKTE